MTNSKYPAESIAMMGDSELIKIIADLLNDFLFDEVTELVGPNPDFLEWMLDRFDNSESAKEFYCIAVRDWSLPGNEVDTMDLATEFVEWLEEQR